MWLPRTEPLTNTDAALIDRDYEDLLFDDRPILFIGRNRLNERVVGSSIESVKGVESYFHCIVDESLFVDFRQRAISYPELMQRASSLFVLHWTGSEIPSIYHVKYSDIPEDYKPDAKAFCPESN